MVEDKTITRTIGCGELAARDLCDAITSLAIEGHVDPKKLVKIAVPGSGHANIVAIVAEPDGTLVLVAEA